MELAGKHIVLGVTGGIAAYKAAELVRLLVREGAEVQVVMTEAATRFVTPVTFQALSGKPVFTDQWDPRVANNMAHIDLSRKPTPCSSRRLRPISWPNSPMAWRTTC
jgi:phosphopantothenoylcysteine decarboxylase/phosphopantothenate--cysteine ligase